MWGLLSEESKKIVSVELRLGGIENIIDHDFPRHDFPDDVFAVNRITGERITRAQYFEERRKELFQLRFPTTLDFNQGQMDDPGLVHFESKLGGWQDVAYQTVVCFIFVFREMRKYHLKQ